MKKTVLIFSGFLLFTSYLFSQGTWVQKADFGGGARQGVTGFSVGSKGYFLNGLNCFSTLSCIFNDLWEYDRSTDVWTQKANLPGMPRAYSVAITIGNKGYVGPGSNQDLSIYYNDIWEYDPTINSWTQKANFPLAGRAGMSAFSIGNKGYFGLGYRSGISYNDFWEFDALSNSWTQKSGFPMSPRSFASSFSIGNKGYVGMGWDGSVVLSSQCIYNDLWEYNPFIDSWKQKVSLPGSTREWAVGFSIGNFGYISTGDTVLNNKQYSPIAEVWQYSPNSDSWLKMTDYGGASVSGACGFSIGCKGYVGTGLSSAFITTFRKDFWEFTPPGPSAALAGINTICSGDSTSLFASGGLFFQWSTGETTNSIAVQPTATTTYSVIASDGCGTSTASMTVTVIPQPVADFASDVNACEKCVEFASNSLNGVLYAWDFGDNATSSSQDNNHCYADTGTYSTMLIVSSATGMCKDTVRKNVSFSDPDETTIFVPNVFTPNGDGINDEFIIQGLDKCYSYGIKIYNRWGILIFQAEETSFAWAGRTTAGIKAEEGVYYYILFNNETERKGFVTLMR